MRLLPDGKQMQKIDAATIQEIGVPSLVLQERAAYACYEFLKKKAVKSFLILAGSGNNGADGLALGRMLYLDGLTVRVCIIGNEEKATNEWKTQINILRNLDMDICTPEDAAEFVAAAKEECLVDSVFGVGLSRPLGGRYAEVAEAANVSGKRIFAVDIPSGVFSTDGSVNGAAFKADWTVTFGALKKGMALYPGREYCGETVVADIGFPRKAFEAVKPDTFTFTPEDLKRLPRRMARSNKGTYGRLLLVAGSKNMAGAAVFAARAAYRAGAGLVRVLTPEDNRVIVQQSVPEAILTTYDPEHVDMTVVENCLSWATAVAAGPGLGTEACVKDILVKVLQHTDLPVVLDADALNILAKNPDLKEKLSAHMVVTPHPGEMARLMGKKVPEITENISAAADTFALQYQTVCVMKDASTVVTAPETAREPEFPGCRYINMSGCAAMAKGGSGDVLTGIIAGLLAQGCGAFKAACLGVYIHGLAGELAEEAYGAYGVTATDIAEMVGKAMEFGADNE